ncbi:MAG: hypothetical protein M1824_002065 [Vezdaea acicularis]|nr:MAG: hypothetical protein M1824_002065 [Vezdaea acicularis]
MASLREELPAFKFPADSLAPDTMISPTTSSNGHMMATTSRSPYASPDRGRAQEPPEYQLVSTNHVSPRATLTSPMDEYIVQSRVLMERQRLLFEQERSLFNQERSLWETERKGLYDRVQELESALSRQMDTVMIQAQGNSFGLLPNDPTRSRQSSGTNSEDRFWEGSSSRAGSVASRSFESHSSHSSPQKFSPPESRNQGPGIDISLVQKDLDGITLKPSAVPPAIVAQIRSPSPMRSPSPSPSRGAKATNGGGNSLSPHNPMLTKHAGHTPNASVFSLEDSGQATPTQKAAKHRASIAAPPPQLEPMANHDTDVQPSGEPELIAPLGLLNEEAHDSTFLSVLDSKLLEEAKKLTQCLSETSSVSEEAVHDTTDAPSGQSEPEVQLKFKRSMNFGSVFGAKVVGST